MNNNEMKIVKSEITIRELVEGTKKLTEVNEGEDLLGYGGKLNIRPKYQRDFVYETKEKVELIKTILKGFPINIMYWVQTSKENEPEKYELLDGQQRTLSICEYFNDAFGIKYGDDINNSTKYNNLKSTHKELSEKFLDYKIEVYKIINGTDTDKIEWFKIINIPGKTLTEQELRNAIYTGDWLTDAKKIFSSSSSKLVETYSKYFNNLKVNRQEYLEKILKWVSLSDEKYKKDIRNYMAEYQNKADASHLYLYSKNVLNWVDSLFPNYRKDMKGIEWGELYNKYKEEDYNPNELEKNYIKVLNNEDFEGKDTKGIYYYLITGQEKHLALRTFNDKQKQVAFENQKGKCPKCENIFTIDKMEGDHILPWSKGGLTIQDNCQMLCKKCNGEKSNN